MSKFQEQIKILEDGKLDLNKKVENLESQITELTKDKVKVERDRLQIKVEFFSVEVAELEKIISQKDVQIEKEKQFGERKSIEEKEKGKQEVLRQIIQTYNKPFDELIISSTISSVERDLSIVGNNIEVQQKLRNLQKYFVAEQVLSKKYNENKVKTTQTKLGSLDQTELVIHMTDILRKYELRRNYRFNFYDYPYLSEIVLEIMKQKQKDANTDVSYLLDKL
jgi:hypothetical protein